MSPSKIVPLIYPYRACRHQQVSLAYSIETYLDDEGHEDRLHLFGFPTLVDIVRQSESYG